MMKGKQVDFQTHGRMRDRHLLQFSHKSGTEMMVMTENNKMVEMMGVM
jgi:hypothetical protein